MPSPTADPAAHRAATAALPSRCRSAWPSAACGCPAIRPPTVPDGHGAVARLVVGGAFGGGRRSSARRARGVRASERDFTSESVGRTARRSCCCTASRCTAACLRRSSMRSRSAIACTSSICRATATRRRPPTITLGSVGGPRRRVGRRVARAGDVPRLVVRRTRRAAHRADASRSAWPRSCSFARRRASSPARTGRTRWRAETLARFGDELARFLSPDAAALPHVAGARKRSRPRDARYAPSRAVRAQRAVAGDACRRCCSSSPRPTCAPRRERIAAPALVVTGARDALTPAAAGAWLARAIAGRAPRRDRRRRARALPVAPRCLRRHRHAPFSMSTNGRSRVRISPEVLRAKGCNDHAALSRA